MLNDKTRSRIVSPDPRGVLSPVILSLDVENESSIWTNLVSLNGGANADSSRNHLLHVEMDKWKDEKTTNLCVHVSGRK